MKAITLHNKFHGTEVTIRPREDGTISVATERRARRELCGLPDCRCFSSNASGPDTLIIGQAEPVYRNGRCIGYKLAIDNT